MLRSRSIAAVAVIGALAGTSAYACRVHKELVPGDIRYADVVVTGRIVNYRIVRDEAFRRRMLASPMLTPDMRRFYADKNAGVISDYARFDVLVDEVLVGKAPRRISVTWDNSTFGEPKTMDAGRFLIALRKTDSRTPPLRGPSATILPSPEPGSLTVLQAPCADAFILANAGDQARAVREILASGAR